MTQFGLSFKVQVVPAAPPFDNLAANPPECPPDTRCSVTPLPDEFQPLVDDSNPGLPTRFAPETAVGVGVAPDRVGVGVGVSVAPARGVGVRVGVATAGDVGVRVGVGALLD